MSKSVRGSMSPRGAWCYRATHSRRIGTAPSLADFGTTMSDDNQTVIPRPFIELFVPTGAVEPREPRAVIAERYDLCEDMAQMLTEHAKAKLFELGVEEQDVLERVHRGLLAEGLVVAGGEAGWVICRLAELLEWPIPPWANRP